MTFPKTPQQLSDAIESLVASYIDGLRRSAQQAVERSFSRPGVTRGVATATVERSGEKRQSSKRRTAAALKTSTTSQ